MPKELPELTPQDVHEILSDWQDPNHHKKSDHREILHTTENLIDMLTEPTTGSGADEPPKAETVFKIPDQAQTELDEHRAQDSSAAVHIEVRRVPIEVSQAMGLNNLEEARAEIDRRDNGGYSSPRLVREAIGEPAMTPEDSTRKEARAVAAHARHAHKPRARRSYRAHFKDTTDYVIREQKGDTTAPTNPDADVDEIFGTESAKRLI